MKLVVRTLIVLGILKITDFFYRLATDRFAGSFDDWYQLALGVLFVVGGALYIRSHQRSDA